MSLFAASQLLPAAADVNTNFHVFLFLGQSNMVGLNTPEAEDLVAHPRVFKLTTAGAWAPGAAPIQGSGVGPARTCGNYIAETLTNITVGLVSRAVSGSAVAQWQKGEAFYEAALTAARAAMTSGVIKAVFWHQGEADGSNGNYAGDLARVIENLRADLGIPDLAFIMSQIGTTGAGGGVNDHISRIVNSMPRTAMASCKGMVLKDNVHYDPASQRILGERLARSYLHLAGALPADELWITPVRLPRAGRNSAYTNIFILAGATETNRTWVIAGSTPAGTTFTNGVIAGSPTASGTRSFSVEATDGTQSVVEAFSVRTEDAFPTSKIEILNGTVPWGIVGEPYREQLFAYAQAPPVAWSISGAIPPGMIMVDGVLSNDAGFAAPGRHAFTASVTDGAGSDSQSFTMDVFELDPPGGIVNFEGFVPQSASLQRSPSVVDSNAHLIAFDDTAAGRFFSSDDPFAQFRGGMKTYYGAGPVPATMNLSIRLNDSGAAPNRFYAQANTAPSAISAILIWPSNLFSAPFAGLKTRFGSTPGTASFRMQVNNAGNDRSELRFIARDGTDYYISEQAFSGAGIFTLTNFQNNGAAGKRWALYDPGASPFPPPATGLVFNAMNFQDVTAVGFFYTGRRNMYLHEFAFDVFTVKAEVPEPCVTILLLAAGLGMARACRVST
ncbi:sialate O-acetylesterase [bacterium]|nr:sialate O-acetylesterase [bacterium]